MATELPSVPRADGLELLLLARELEPARFDRAVPRWHARLCREQLRHTRASMLIESGLSPLRLQRWMGHHSAAFTLETYGHLIDGDLGPPLDLRVELRAPTGSRETPSSV
jgi:integrase